LKAIPLYQQWKFPIVFGLLFIGLIFSKWLLSVSQLLLFLAVLSDPESRRNLLRAFRSPIVLSLILLYVMHALGLLWSSNIKYGLKDLQVKLPILIFPILLYAVGKAKKNTAVVLIFFFVACVLLLSIISLVNFYGSPVVPERIAIGQSHIRFSLLICLSLLFIIHFRHEIAKKHRWMLLPVVLILLYFLIILESFTGYVVLAFLLFFLPFLYRDSWRSKKIRYIIPVAQLLVAAVAIWGIADVRNRCFPEPEKAVFSELDMQSDLGHDYVHYPEMGLAENGHRVYLYIAEEEMVKAWNQRCKSPIVKDSSYSSRTNILMRYLSSKGLRKDSTGVSKLTSEDISNIEKGYSNYLVPGMDPYRERIYRFLWEWSVYIENNDPSGHSLTQRFEYWKASSRIISQNLWVGVGTGDIPDAFQQEYECMGSKLDKEYRLRSHNQFLSITVALGLAGLLVFLFSLLAPFLLFKIPQLKLYLGFIFIFLLSLISEDTLETQVGVTFYALFNSFLLFTIPDKKTLSEE